MTSDRVTMSMVMLGDVDDEGDFDGDVDGDVG